eukprot:363428-Chlamydomonas_euryale.AAC.4
MQCRAVAPAASAALAGWWYTRLPSVASRSLATRHCGRGGQACVGAWCGAAVQRGSGRERQLGFLTRRQAQAAASRRTRLALGRTSEGNDAPDMNIDCKVTYTAQQFPPGRKRMSTSRTTTTTSTRAASKRRRLDAS